jgi:predicted NBD/HSP70 family sugar kinase
MQTASSWVVVGLDNGGTKNNATVLEPEGRFLVEGLIGLRRTGTERERVRAVGLDTPGPASAEGVISSRGSTNFGHASWANFDFRGALEERLGIRVVYNNDGNAAALYAHHVCFGSQAMNRSSVAAIVGTGLGGGVIEAGRIVKGAVGFAGELGHVHIPMQGLLGEGQPLPVCNCGFSGDVESVASLSGIELNLLPYWLGRHPDHELSRLGDLREAAKRVRGYGERGDALARAIFEQQAAAIGRLFTIASRFSDPDAYFLGGGVAESSSEFRSWFLDRVRAHTSLKQEQLQVARFELVPDLDMAGARGAALAALEALHGSAP